jgi:hypothetical protein
MPTVTSLDAAPITFAGSLARSIIGIKPVALPIQFELRLRVGLLRMRQLQLPVADVVTDMNRFSIPI